MKVGTTTPIDLQPFCDHEISRYNLGSPWVYCGWKYATDGRICVRMPTIDPDTKTGVYPRVYELFKGRNFGYCRKPFPDLPIEAACLLCDGRGRETDNCRNCFGEKGHRCAQCHGAGKIPSNRICRACRGAGIVPQDTVAGNRKFMGWQLALIGHLPGVRIWEGGEPEKPMQFTAAGGLQGLVMPIEGKS